MKEDFVLLLKLVIISTFIFKVFYWVTINDIPKKTHFFTSFFRMYSVYQQQDAPSKKTLKFWKMSNNINYIFWLSIFVYGLFIMNEFLRI